MKTLAEKLGAPVVPTVASKRKGIDQLIETAISLIDEDVDYKAAISYGENIDQEVERIKQFLVKANLTYPPQWMAVKLLEGDEYINQVVRENKDLKHSLEFKNVLASLEDNEIDYQLEIVDKRYEFVNSITKETVFRPKETVKTKTDKIDKILMHKHFGLPIFALIMLAVFQLTFAIGEDILGEAAASGIEVLGGIIENYLIGIHSPEWLVSFVAEGLIGGVGAVVEFIPSSWFCIC